jgi:hypothetical protein
MSDIALVVIAISIFVLTFLTVFWMLVFSHLCTERVESFLSKSKFVANNRVVLSGFGLIGKVLRSGAIALMFLIPRLCERRGLIEKDELLNLPLDLKRKLLAPWIFAYVLFFSMLIFWLFVVKFPFLLSPDHWC